MMAGFDMSKVSKSHFLVHLAYKHRALKRFDMKKESCKHHRSTSGTGIVTFIWDALTLIRKVLRSQSTCMGKEPPGRKRRQVCNFPQWASVNCLTNSVCIILIIIENSINANRFWIIKMTTVQPDTARYLYFPVLPLCPPLTPIPKWEKVLPPKVCIPSRSINSNNGPNLLVWTEL